MSVVAVVVTLVVALAVAVAVANMVAGGPTVTKRNRKGF